MLKLHFQSFVGFTLLFLCSLTSIAVKAQDLKPEEIITRHLESIGTKEKRAAVKNRMAAGASTFQSKLPNRKTAGKALIVSEAANNLMFISSFSSQEYPFEKIGFFSDKVSLPFVTAGAKSPLGTFIADHNKILSEGLFAGSISTTWNLLNPQFKKEKFGGGGTKKIDGRKTYVLDFYPGGSSAEFTVKLYFDAETFRHVRTEYRHVISPREQKMGTLGEQNGVKIALTESFADFKTIDGLTLPHAYKLHYVTDSNSGTYEYEWNVAVSQYLFNQKLAPDFFSFDEK